MAEQTINLETSDGGQPSEAPNELQVSVPDVFYSTTDRLSSGLFWFSSVSEKENKDGWAFGASEKQTNKKGQPVHESTHESTVLQKAVVCPADSRVWELQSGFSEVQAHVNKPLLLTARHCKLVSVCSATV